MHPEPIRHHYIPQFILKNFCFEDRRLYYFDKQTSCVSIKDTRDVFMARNLYRDEINYAADPVKIEKDLAEYEREIAQIIRERFLDGREIFITPQEDAKLKICQGKNRPLQEGQWYCIRCQHPRDHGAE